MKSSNINIILNKIKQNFINSCKIIVLENFFFNYHTDLIIRQKIGQQRGVELNKSIIISINEYNIL